MDFSLRFLTVLFLLEWLSVWAWRLFWLASLSFLRTGSWSVPSTGSHLAWSSLRRWLSAYSIVLLSEMKISVLSLSSSLPSALRMSFHIHSVNERACSTHTLSMEPSSWSSSRYWEKQHQMVQTHSVQPLCSTSSKWPVLWLLPFILWL